MNKPAALTLQPVIIQNRPEKEIHALSPETVASVTGTVARLSAITITDADTLAAADASYETARALRKAIDDQRKALKDPFRAIAEGIDDAARPALQLLDTAIAAAKARADAWNREQTRKYEEEQRRLAEEARRRQEEEERKQREAAAAAAKARAEAEAKARAEAAELSAVFGTEVAPALPPAAPPAPAAAPMKPLYVPAAPPPPAMSKAVGSRKEKRVTIVDPNAIPRTQGSRVLMEPNLREIEACWKLGIAVPGTTYADVEIPVSRG